MATQYQQFLESENQSASGGESGGDTQVGGFIEEAPGGTTGIVPEEPGGPFDGPSGPATPGGKPVGWQGEKPWALPNTPERMPSATEWNVTDDQLVEKRMEGLMEKDSDLFQTVSERARRQHAARGGQNSMMATLGAEMAVADMAFQIASQDAQTFARSAEFNAAMKNQFGLAEQKFMHNAMLSEQNFRQARLLQKEEIAGRLSAISAQTAGAMKLANLEQEHWKDRNAIQHDQTLEVLDLQHGYQQERMFQEYEQNWLLREQAQAHQLEQYDRQTDNSIRAAEQQFGWQMALNFQSELSANQRQLLQGISMIGSTEGLSAEQQERATRELMDIYNASGDLLSSFYASGGGPGMHSREQPWETAPGSGELYTGEEGSGVGTKEGKEPGSQQPWRNPYEGRYGDYLSYGHGGYSLYMPPVPTSMGGQPGQGMQMVGGSMYGSNLDYAEQGWEYTQPWHNPAPYQTMEDEGGGMFDPGGNREGTGGYRNPYEDTTGGRNRPSYRIP